jgi:hypothetical protein
MAGLIWLAGHLAGSTGCASGHGRFSDPGFYQNRELGYRIARPDTAGSGGNPSWKRVSVKGAELAFRQIGPEPGHRPAMMVLISECGRGADSPSLIARQLLIGIHDRALPQGAPVALRGDPGWMQVFDTLQEGVMVRVKTISIRSDDCTFDWALVAPGPFRAAEDDFDAWWTSFERRKGDSAATAGSQRVPGLVAAVVSPS